MIKKFFILSMVFLFMALLNTQNSWAHRLNISAWLENDNIIVAADTGANAPAANAKVTISDKDTGKELVEGITDSSGRFVFTVPGVVREGHGLDIVVNAGQGHRGEWSMSASELYAAASLTAGFDQARLEGASTQFMQPGTGEPAGQNFPGAAQAGQQMRPDEFKKIVHEALEVQLAPIRQQIAAQKAGGISLVEIIGGLGWIMGLVGVALFFISRKKA